MAEKMEFQSEAKQVLELMINSVYSNPDIFVRELVSNASDAIDKLRIESLSDQSLAEYAKNGRIDITIDKKAGTLTFSDNGVGMSRDDLVSYLGTIARSGTGEFIKGAQRSEERLRGRPHRTVRRRLLFELHRRRQGHRRDAQGRLLRKLEMGIDRRRHLHYRRRRARDERHDDNAAHEAGRKGRRRRRAQGTTSPSGRYAASSRNTPTS